jgi:formate dehydrogenase subunit delta
MSPDRLIQMANQIGQYFIYQKDVDPAVAIADHLTKFWDPRMRTAIEAHVAGGGIGLDPAVLQAVLLLRPVPV